MTHACLGQLCQVCTARLRWLLSGPEPEPGAPLAVWPIPALYDALSPEPGSSGDGGGSAKPGPRSPVDDWALGLRDSRSRFSSGRPGSAPAACWGAALRLGITVTGGGDLGLMRQLARLADVIAGHQWAGEFLDNLEHAHRDLRYALGDHRPVPIGTCDVCTQRLYASSAGAVVVCSKCKTEYDASAQIEMVLNA